MKNVMRSVKWHEIYDKERQIFKKILNPQPVNWVEVRILYLNFIKAIDESTEVYNMENRE